MGRNDTERQQDARSDPVADADAAIGATMSRETAPRDGGDDDLAREPGTIEEVSSLDQDHPVVDEDVDED